MFTIRERSDGRWEVLAGDGTVVSDHPDYDSALAAIGDQLAGPDSTTSDGLLSDRWVSVDGIAFNERIDSRDFTATVWTWRDPSVSTLPLMLQTETEPGHFGAELAGFIETLAVVGDHVEASGRFYDTEAGQMFRDLLLGGRSFGVSVDPGDVSAELVCTEEDADGFCIDGYVSFSAYQIIGLTGTPFPGFSRAQISLAGQPATVVASGNLKVDRTVERIQMGQWTSRIPARWFDDLLPVAAMVASVTVPDVIPAMFFEDPGFSEPTPLTVERDGHIFGHAALWGSCHLGLPGCETPFHDPDYQLFHLGYVETDQGPISCGSITIGTGHASIRRGVGMAEAISHYDNTGTQAAWVRCGEDSFGIWFSGTVCPDLDDADLRRLEAAPLSADWRPVGGLHRLVRLLGVNTPGYPVPRTATGYENGALTAAIFTVGRDDFDCGCGGSDALAGQVARLERIVDLLDLEHQAADALGRSLL